MITDKKILVVNGAFYGNTVADLGEVTDDKKEFLNNPEDFDLILFTGGADVSPELYGETSPNHMCGTNPNRDTEETLIFECALKHDIKMTGICRGSQFINVMSGGRMMHHVDNHGIGGLHSLALSHPEFKEAIMVNSWHHQMIIPPEHGHVIGWSGEQRSNVYYGDKDALVKWERPETEIILIPDTKCCGVQYHPEAMGVTSDGFRFYQRLLTDFMLMSIDDFTKAYTGEEYVQRNGIGTMAQST